MTKYPIITICGSMRYYQKMLEVAGKLTIQGNIVLMPFVSGMKEETKEALDRMHKAKIDMSEAIVVVGSHIGESTESEIEYAKTKNVTVLYWTEHFGAMK